MTSVALTPDTANGKVTVAVTGAPVPTPAYTQGTGVDGWTVSAGTITAGGTGGTYTGAEGFLLHANAGDSSDYATATKTIAGLTAGTKYRMTAWVKRGANAAYAQLAVTGFGASADLLASSPWQQIEFVFTATATSHVFNVKTRNPSGFDQQADLYVDDIKVEAVNAVYLPTTITRTDANGTRPVRLQPGQEPISGSMTVTDYEAALTGTITYDVKDTAGVTTSASTTLDGSASPRIHPPVLPGYGQALHSVSDYSATQDNRATVHWVISRSDPVVTTGVLGYRTGRLSAYCASHADARALVTMAGLGEVLMLRQPSGFNGMDMYFVPTGVSYRPERRGSDGWRWTVDFDYTEVAVPTAALMGAAGWTWDDVVATYATWADVASAYATWSELETNT